MKNLKHLLTLLLFVSSLILQAQDTESAYQAIVHLKNGTTFQGEIIKYEKGKDLILQLEGGDTLKIEHEELDRIEYKLVNSNNYSEEGIEHTSDTEGSGENMLDVIRLSNGSVFKGKIIETKEAEYYLLELAGGDVLRLEWDEIASIVKEDNATKYFESKRFKRKRSRIEFKEKWRKEREEKRRVYAFKERGWYNITYFSSTSGEQDDEFQFGLGVHNIIGYQFSRMFGLGLGLGADTYTFKTGETIYPLFLEGRGYFKEDINSFFYSLAAGYGFAFKNEGEDIVKANGGFMIHPSVGTRFGASADTNVLLDFGVKIQEAHFTREFLFTGEREIKDIIYKRLTVRLGLIF
jgi:hypothetical protein